MASTHAEQVPTPVALARGDGIGPEITDAVVRVLEAAQAPLRFEEVQLGQTVYEQGHSAGITPEAWKTIRRCRVLLKAPITTPTGGGVKSLNVTLRKSLGLFANLRPVRSFAPYIATRHPGMDVVIVRENEEDLYAGIEHQQTPEVTQCLKLISRPGSERLIRFAFDYAQRLGRKRVCCLVKDNIMKRTDGLFHAVFEEVAADYPELVAERRIVDIGTALIADRPGDFDVVVTPNLYGDIISDVAAQIAGSVGLAGSANIGDGSAMFEAVHGSAPDIAGRDLANPSGLLKAAVMMLVHLGARQSAERIRNAWLRAIEDGQHTVDISGARSGTRSLGTQDFASAVVDRLGEEPRRLEPARYADAPEGFRVRPATPRRRPQKLRVGVDVFVDWDAPGRPPEALADHLRGADADGLTLRMITNRGVKVWPEGLPETFCTDHWRCRWQRDGEPVAHRDIVALLSRLTELGVDFIKTEQLCTFDGEPGFSLGQGQ